MLPRPASRTPSLVRRAPAGDVSGPWAGPWGCWGPQDRWVLAQYTCPNRPRQEGNRLLVEFFSGSWPIQPPPTRPADLLSRGRSGRTVRRSAAVALLVLGARPTPARVI